MIINNVSYKNVFPPKHWKLSPTHRNDFNKMINKYYNPINSYNIDDDIKVLLQEIYESTDIYMSCQKIHCLILLSLKITNVLFVLTIR